MPRIESLTPRKNLCGRRTSGHALTRVQSTPCSHGKYAGSYVFVKGITRNILRVKNYVVRKLLSLFHTHRGKPIAGEGNDPQLIWDEG